MENTLSLGPVNSVIIAGPIVPAKPSRRTFSARTSQNSALPTPSTAEPNVQDTSNQKPFLARESRPRQEGVPSSRASDQPVESSSLEQSTSENYPVLPAEYTTPVQDEKLQHHQLQESHYEVTEQAEQQQPFRRRNGGKVRKNRNTGVTELPIQGLFSSPPTPTEEKKITGISINPGSGFRTKVIKIKPTSVPLYIKGHGDNKHKYRYDLFNKQNRRPHLTLKFKKSNKTSSEDEKDMEDSTAATFAEGQQSSSVEIVLPGSLSLTDSEEIYLTDGK